ncbi:MAG: hypothetical protein MZU79_01910 [Anaerotruncus sp.]|nr:hypothetical protein [Anaerotruncus sp.]
MAARSLTGWPPETVDPAASAGTTTCGSEPPQSRSLQSPPEKGCRGEPPRHHLPGQAHLADKKL